MIKLNDVKQLTPEVIKVMDMSDLFSYSELVLDAEEIGDREKLKSMMLERADVFKARGSLKKVFSDHEKTKRQLVAEYKRREAQRRYEYPLELNENGKPISSYDNFLTIMRDDIYYKYLFYNEMTNCQEVHEHDLLGGIKIRKWQDVDSDASQQYLESAYNLRDEKTHAGALRLLFHERRYNPIADIVNGLEWDGIERCEHFLTRWAKAEDTPYIREVSRLIFAGGINRLYEPGCKFDDVPVLVGTAQGEGKSSLIRWLAINDSYFGEISDMDGQRSIEQLDGVWIGEIAELSAFNKSKELEQIKAYITRQRDKYRKPYSVYTEDRPRRCIFIGTTNQEHFLKDKTGNRRFYPVKVHSNGYELYEHEAECREYILQCWAEAKAKYDKGEMPNFARKDLLAEYKEVQEEAMEDDWRVGCIRKYLDSKSCGENVCVKELKAKALSSNPDFPENPTPKDSQEITQIMNKMDGWIRLDKTVRTDDYGPQRCWQKTIFTPNIDELPF